MPDRRFDRSEKAIKESMLKLMKEKPLEKISVTDICREADINRSTFYTHYVDIKALHLALEKDAASVYLSTLAMYRYDTATDDMVRQMLRLLKEKKDIFALLYSDQSTGIAMKMIIDTTRERTLPIWEKKSNLSKEELDYLFEYFMAGTNAVLKKWVNSNYSLPEDRLLQLIDDIVKYGLYYDVYIK